MEKTKKHIFKFTLILIIFTLYFSINIYPQIKASTTTSLSSQADISLVIDLSSRSYINCDLDWQNKCTINLDFNRNTGQIKTKINIENLLINQLTKLFPLEKIRINAALIKSAKLDLTSHSPAQLNLNFDIIDINASYQQISITLPEIEITGQANIIENKLSYSSEINFTQGICENLPLISQLSSIEATCKIDEKTIYLEKLTAKLGENTITCQGNFDYLNQPPCYKLNAAMQSTITDFWTTINKIKPANFNYLGPGEITLDCEISGNIKSKTPKYQANYQIKNAQWQQMNNINLKGVIEPDLASIEEGKFFYQDIPLYIQAKVKNFISPEISFAGQNDFLKIAGKTRLNLTNENQLDIDSLTFISKYSEITSQGNITLGKIPSLKLNTVCQIELQDLQGILKKFKIKTDALEKIKAQGTLTTKSIATGELNWDKLRIELTGYSQNLSLYNIIFENLQFDLLKDNATFILSPLNAQIMEGTLEMHGQLNTKREFAKTQIIVKNVNLTPLVNALGVKNTDLSGRIFTESNFETASFKDLKQIKGDGALLIRDGKLWEIDFLKGLGEFLFIPAFEGITFTEGYTDFQIREKRCLFSNIHLASAQMQLKGEGTLDFDGPIDFRLFTEFNPRILAASEDLRQIFTQFLGNTGLAINVNGTYKKPTYKLKTVARPPADQLGDWLKKIIK